MGFSGEGNGERQFLVFGEVECGFDVEGGEEEGMVEGY